MKYTIRFAQASDGNKLLEIYSYFVLHTPVTFESEVPSVDEFQKRIKDIQAEYPYLVCEADGEVVGYAYAHRQKERAAYRFNAELSVYVKKDCVGQGIGSRLYEKLIALLALLNVQNLYAYVTAPNERSEALHERFGFKQVCVAENTGYKFGKWHGVTEYDKAIGKHESTPKPVLRIQALSNEDVLAILQSEAE